MTPIDIPFVDRREAGRALAWQLRDVLAEYGDADQFVVEALPRGGVPVAAEVANALRAPLDIVVVRKIGMPSHEEFAVGAIGPDGTAMLNEAVMDEFGITDRDLAPVIEAEQAELRRRELLYRGDRPAADVTGKTVIVVDDGLATGASMMVAVTAIKSRSPKSVIVAVPVASPSAVSTLRPLVDRVVSVATPAGFRAVGQWYGDFSQTTDAEVERCLAGAAARRPGADGP